MTDHMMETSSGVPFEPRSLAASLGAMSDADLAALFRERPDLIRSLPDDLTGLAARCASPASVRLAWHRLNRLEQQVAQVLVAHGGPVALNSLMSAMDPSGDRSTRSAIAHAIGRLRALALVWGEDDSLRPVAALTYEAGPAPCDLDPDDRSQRASIAHYLVHPDDFFAELDSAPASARAALDRMTWGPPRGRLANADRPVSAATASTPIEWLLARGMLVASGPDSVVLPREIALLLRGGAYVQHVEMPPSAPSTGTVVADADATAGMHALLFTRATGRLLNIIDEGGTRLLRTTGIYQRDAAELARRLQLTLHETALVADVARAAGLLGPDAHAGLWTLTRAAEAWRVLPEQRQWAALALAWRDTDAHAALAGGSGEPDNRILSDSLYAPGIAEIRRLALRLAATAPPGAVIDADSLVGSIGWHRPRLHGRDLPAFVAEILADAETIGACGRGALSAAGRLLAESDAQPAAVGAAVRWPPLVDRVVLQADLTATALGPMTQQAEGRIGLLADLESTGAGTVYRFSTASLNRAFDAGMATAEVLAELTGLSVTDVPGTLAALVSDVGRRHGSIRVEPASSVITSDDDAALAAAMSERTLAHLRLRRIASGIAISPLGHAEVTAALRKSGVAAVSAMDAAPSRPRRLPAPPAVRTEYLGDDHLAAAVRAVRAGESARAVLEGPTAVAPVAPHDLVEAIAGAIRNGRPLWLDFSDPTGTRRVRLVDPLTLRGGLLSGFDHREQRVTAFALSRIAGIAVVPAGDQASTD